MLVGECLKKRIAGIYPSFFLLLLAASGAKEDTVVFKIAGNKCTRYITSLGLAIYLCQSLAIMVVKRNYLKTNYSDSYIFIALTIIFAVLLHEIIEKPGKKLVLEIKVERKEK